MPELPEAERAAKLLRDTVQDGTIESVETTEDTIVYEGTTHEEFAKELQGRKITGVPRHGKVFWLELDGEGRHPVLHLGMTGMIQVKGQEPTWYRQRPKETNAWPPRFMKFILNVRHPSSSELIQVAFMDARRLARIRLRQKPRDEKPVSELGFDPILSMPSVADFSSQLRNRSMPVKALLLDQGFSAGVGNWVADEILYHARVHPEQRTNTISDEQLAQLHHFTRFVCQTAVDANADSDLFPEDWLFKHRWGKGKKAQHTLKLPAGELATIKWIKVGGRTSAYVEELQHMPEGGREKPATKTKRKAKDISEGEEDAVEEEVAMEATEAAEEEPPKAKRKKAAPAAKAAPTKTSAPRKAKKAEPVAKDEEEEGEPKVVRRRSTRLSN